MIEQFTAFIRYCKTPRPYLPAPTDQKTQFSEIHYLLMIAFMIEIVYMMLLSTIVAQDDISHKMDDLMTMMGPVGIFIAAVIIGPILEELFFRLPLKYPKHAFTGILFATGFIVLAFIPTENQILQIIGSSIFFLSILSSVLFFNKKQREENGDRKLAVAHRKYFRWLFYGQAILFGMAHISNFNFAEMDNLYIVPLLIVPQLTLGFILGYSRIKYGFWSNVYLHMVHNAVLISLTFMGA